MTKPKLITWRNESHSLKDWARLMQMTEKKMRLFFKDSMTNNTDTDIVKLQMSFNIDTFMTALQKQLPAANNPTITPRHRELQLLELRSIDKDRIKSPALGNGALNQGRK